MSHPNPTHDRSNEYPDDHYKPTGKKKREHPRPISKIAKARSPQLHNLVNSWKYDLVKASSPKQKAIEKAIDRHSRKKKK